MEFEYLKQTTAMASLDVEDIGNVCIEANTDLNECFYMVIKTTMGTTNILTYGPVVPGLDMLEKECACTFRRINFNEGKIKEAIKTFLNPLKKQITQAQITDIEEINNNCIDMVKYIQKEGSY